MIKEILGCLLFAVVMAGIIFIGINEEIKLQDRVAVEEVGRG